MHLKYNDLHNALSSSPNNPLTSEPAAVCLVLSRFKGHYKPRACAHVRGEKILITKWSVVWYHAWTCNKNDGHIYAVNYYNYGMFEVMCCTGPWTMGVGVVPVYHLCFLKLSDLKRTQTCSIAIHPNIHNTPLLN